MAVITGGIEQEQQEEAQEQQQEAEQAEGAATGTEAEQEADEVIISLGDEPAQEDEQEQQNAPAWVKDLRQKQRETAKENRELKAKLEAASQKAAPADALGVKPTMADFDFDEDAFEAALTGWHEKKRAVESEAAQKRKADEDLQADYNSKITAYNANKITLKVPDFEDAEAAVLSNFNQVQQAVMVKAPDAHKLVYAVGKSKAELARLAAIKDPIDFALAVGALGTKLKETPRKAAPPPPETKVSSSGASVSAVDATLEKLRADALKSGDMSLVMEYKRDQKKKAA